MRRLIRGLGVDQLGSIGIRSIQKRWDVGGIMLAVLIHRDDPVTTRGGHPRQSGGMLAEVPTKPNWTNPGVPSCKFANRQVALAGTSVPDEYDLADSKEASLWCVLPHCEWCEFLDEARKCLFSAVDRDDDGDGQGSW